jgi:hypothetical protein
VVSATPHCSCHHKQLLDYTSVVTPLSTIVEEEPTNIREEWTIRQNHRHDRIITPPLDLFDSTFTPSNVRPHPCEEEGDNPVNWPISSGKRLWMSLWTVPVFWG